MEASRGMESSWSQLVLRHRHFLIEHVEPDFGLVDELYANEVLSAEEKAEVNAENTIYKRNAKLLELIQTSEEFDGFIETLKGSNQTHVVNYLEKDGIYNFDDDWPLLHRERSVLRANQKILIDLLDVQDTLILLYSAGVINSMQRDFITSKQTSYEKNRALLDILSRRSNRDYKKTIRCLHESKQSHIAQMLEEGGVVIRVHAVIPNDKTEDEIISYVVDVLSNRSTEESRRILEGALNVITMRKGESIVLYVYLKTFDELLNCQKMKTSGKLVTVLQKLFIDVILFAKFTQVTAENPENAEELPFTEIFQIQKMTADVSEEDFSEYNMYFVLRILKMNTEKRMTENHLGHLSLKSTKVVEGETQACGNKDQEKTDERYPPTMNPDMEHLPLEVMDIIILKSFLSSRLEKNEMRNLTEKNVMTRLGSVQFSWFQRISKHRFKNTVWKKLSEFSSINHKTALIIRNNRQFLEGYIWPKGFIKQLKSFDCLTDAQAAMIKRRNFKVNIKQQQHKISDLLNVIRFCDRQRQLSFGRCLRQNGQRDAARVELNGGAVVKADVKFSDESRNKVVNEQMVEKLNELILKFRNGNPSDDEDDEDLLEHADVEILGCIGNREAVVWIWCQSQEAFEYVQNVYESNLLARVFSIASKELPLFTESSPYISIEHDQLKQKIVQNPFIFEVERDTEFLIESIDPNVDLLTRLRADGSLTRKEIDDIQQKPTYYEMNNALLKCILTKSRGSQLIEALNETNQRHLTYNLSEEEHTRAKLFHIFQNQTQTNISRMKFIHITKNLTFAEDIAAHMCRDNKLTQKEFDDIKKLEWNSVEAIEELLNIIAKKPRDVYECFLDALKQTNQNHLYQTLVTKIGFENIWKEDMNLAIANNLQFLMENMRSNPLIDLLHSEQLMTDEERELIKNQPNEYCTIREILQWINSTKFDKTSNWQTLIKCLRKSDQNVSGDVLEKRGVTIRSKFSNKLDISTSVKSPLTYELRSLLKEKEELVVEKLNHSNESVLISAQTIEIFGYGIEILPCCRREEDGIIVWFLCHSQAALKRLEEFYESKALLIEKLKTLFQLLSEESHFSIFDSVLITESLIMDTCDFNKQIERRHDMWRGIASGTINGMVILGDEVFICMKRSLEVKVFHKDSFIMIRKFVMKGLENLEDMVGCSRNKRLYIVDKIYTEELCLILAVDPQGNILKPFRVKYGSCRLCVTVEFNVVALLSSENKLIELTAELELIREIKLSLQNPGHFCSLPNGNFVMIYDRYNVGVIDSTRNLVKSAGYFKELFPRCLTVDKAGSICVACDDGRVVFFTSDLEYFKTLQIPRTGIRTVPERICLEESIGLLFMAGRDAHESFIRVCDVSDLDDYV